MARLHPAFIAEVLGRVDLVELIGQRVPLKRAGSSYKACCPFHQEKTPSFHVSPAKQRYHCFGCQANGDAIRFLMDYDNLSFPDAIAELAQQVHLPLPTDAAPSEDALLGRLRDYHTRAEQFFRRQLQSDSGQVARDYLAQRGVNADMIDRFGLGYALPSRQVLFNELRKQGVGVDELLTAGLAIKRDDGTVTDRFRDRLMFPIRDRRGQTLAFGGRTLAPDGQPKYLNSAETPIFHKGSCLFGLFEARQHNPRFDQLVVVEGYLDVIALAQYGIHYATAPLGTAISTEQIEQLFRQTPHVVCCFDGDKAGQAAALRALEAALPTLKPPRRLDFLSLPAADDPDSLIRREGADAFRARLAQAQPFADFFFERLTADVDLHTLHGRAELLQRARPRLKQLPDGPLREVLQQELSRHTQVIEQPAAQITTPTVVSTPPQIASIERQPLRYLTALVLHQPDLAHRVTTLDNLRLLAINNLHAQQFVQLIEFIQQQPHFPHAAALLVHLEGNDAFAELARWEPSARLPVALAFADALQRVEQWAKREQQLAE